MSTLVFIQQPRFLGTSEDDDAYAIARGADGSIYVVGTTFGNYDDQQNNGKPDAFATKYAPDGTKIWTRLIGTDKTDSANGVVAVADSSIYVTGFTYGNLDGLVNNSPLSVDAFLTKYATDGTRVWTRLVGTNDTDYGSAITSSPDGSIYIVGSTYGNLDGQTANGSSDAFLTKYSPDGTKAWTKLIGTRGFDTGDAITVAPDGTIYVAGDTNGNLDGQVNSGGASDAFITKYFSDGTKAWTRLFGSNELDIATGVTTDAKGFVYLAGHKLGTNPDAFVVKYAPDGSRVWNRSIVTSAGDLALAIAAGPGG